jgi:hypothetical protein
MIKGNAAVAVHLSGLFHGCLPKMAALAFARFVIQNPCTQSKALQIE